MTTTSHHHLHHLAVQDHLEAITQDLTPKAILHLVTQEEEEAEEPEVAEEEVVEEEVTKELLPR